MKQVLFIRPGTPEDGLIMWCESGSQQVETLSGWAELATLADHPLASQVCLLLPASEMIFRHFSLPKKGPAALSWMAEETLIGDVDNLHWTILNKKGREVDAVAIDAARLRHWLTRMAEAGLVVTQVLPDAILLPVSEGGSTLVAVEDGYWLRFAPFGATNVDAGLLPLLMAKCQAGESRCYGEVPEGVAVDESLAWEHPLVLIQPQWRTCKVSLLHGAFSLRQGNAMRFRHANVALAMVAALAFGLLVGPRAGMAWMLSQQQDHTKSQMIEVAQHYFPTLRQTSNLKFVFGQNVTKAQKGVFLQLDALDQIKYAFPTVEVSDIDFDNAQNQLTLNVKSMDKQAIADFVARANDSFDFAMQPVSGEAPFTAIITGKYK